MAVNPELSHVLNHAGSLGENTRTCMLVEIRKDGLVTMSRYSDKKSREDFAMCTWYLNRYVNAIFDDGERYHLPPPQAPKEVT